MAGTASSVIVTMELSLSPLAIRRQALFTNNIYEQSRLWSACASAQSDQSLHCSYKETLHPRLPEMQPVKSLIRVRGCAGWSESSLVAHVRRYISYIRAHNLLFLKFWVSLTVKSLYCFQGHTGSGRWRPCFSTDLQIALTPSKRR